MSLYLHMHACMYITYIYVWSNRLFIKEKAIHVDKGDIICREILIHEKQKI